MATKQTTERVWNEETVTESEVISWYLSKELGKSWEMSAAVTFLAFSLCYTPWVAICEWSEGLFTKHHYSHYITQQMHLVQYSLWQTPNS